MVLAWPSQAAALPLDQQYEFPQYIVGQNPRQAAVADFNGDGRPDIVTANQDTDDVSVLLNLFYDKFRPGVRYRTSRRPTGVAVGDFNQDGFPDVATSNLIGVAGARVQTFYWVVSVLLGNGDGTLAQRRSYRVNSGCPVSGTGMEGGVEVGDFNNDGVDDIGAWCVSGGGGYVTVRISNGDGTFQGSRETTVPQWGDVALGDLDGDGIPDLLYTDFNRDIILKRGLGTGFFDDPEPIYAGSGGFITSLALGDFNGDAVTDIVAMQQNSGTNPYRAILLEGLGNGALVLLDFVDMGPAYDALLADLNGDGRLDILSESVAGVGVRLGTGAGFFGPLETYSVNGVIPELAFGDFNGDGRDDVVSVTRGGGTRNVTLMIARSDGTLRRPPQYPAAPNSQAQFIAVADFDLDGANDLVVSSNIRDVAVLPGIGNGRFSPRSRLDDCSGFANSSSGVVIGDFNDDGRPDFATAKRGGSFLAGCVMVRLADPAGGFKPPIEWVDASFSSVLTGIAGADFNNDGHTDLAVSAGVNPSNITDVSGLYVFIAGQSGGLPTVREYNALPSDAVVTGDFTGDGDADIVTAVADGRALSCLEGVGDGTFLARLLSATPDNPEALVTGDFDEDGKLDVVAVTGYDTVTLMRGDGACRFTAGGEFLAGPVGKIAAADIDGDGHLDLVTTNPEANAIMFLAGRGDGSFRSRKSFSAERSPVGLAIDDINGDGQPDVLVGTGDSVSVLLHR